MAEPVSRGRRLSSLFWLAIVVAHAIAAALWWWMMPAGFPLTHPRFFLHRVVPWVLVAYAIIQFVPRARPLRPALLAAIPATYLAAAIAGRILFPVTLSRLFLAPLAVGVVLLVIWWLEHRAHWRRALAVGFPAAALGAFLAFAHVAPAPSTRPANVPFPPELGARRSAVAFDAGPLSLSIYPGLTFISRSPDGCWTLLAAQTMRGSERTWLDVHEEDRALRIESRTDVPRAVYTHLNSYTSLAITGHRRLFLAFSPAPDARIEVLSSDYPTGRPARAAYVDRDRVFHVVQASDAEKGPYTHLASGRLSTIDALTITLYDEQSAIARVTLEDFASQASTELSPTAGWNLPQNAISFSLSGDEPASSASIFVTLAGTGVGRGFDSVGHAPGVYRNRMRVEALGP